MSDRASIAILFSEARLANLSVAGIPAAARAVFCVTRAFDGTPPELLVVAPDVAIPSKACQAELARLTPSSEVRFVAADQVRHARWISGTDAQASFPLDIGDLPEDVTGVSPATASELRRKAYQIVSATAKPSDGIVSRHFNRPISQAMSRLVLRWPGVQPWHATLVAALLAIAMFVALLSGETWGLIAGGLLFQLSSVVDGVDGEIARASFRTSKWGATLDSVADMATNLAFVGGVSWNLYQGGYPASGIAGALGVCVMATGAAIVAMMPRGKESPFNFEAFKHRWLQKPSLLRQWMVWLAMRDFYALAACVVILLGLAPLVPWGFLAGASLWFSCLSGSLVSRHFVKKAD